MIEFYYSMGPNPMKVALFLEEAALSYKPMPIDIRKGEQFDPSFIALNPNSKVPVIVDGDAVVFDSNAILLYLATKTGLFLDKEAGASGAMLSWLMFVASGVGPFSGQSVHFRHRTQEPQEYSANRYAREAERHFSVLDARLADRPYVLGDRYTIVDMAVWGWSRLIDDVIGADRWTALPHLKRLTDEISARPAAAGALRLKDHYAFKAELDEEARRFLFPQNVPRAASLL